MNSKKRIILIIVLLSYFVTAIDGSIVITGLKKMQADLSLNQSTLSWVQNAYILAFGGFILFGGRLSDVYGRKRILNVSLILFGIGSATAGFSINAVSIILSRFVQGIGASILAPTSLALLMDTFEGKERVKAVAWYSSISGLGTSIGLVLGGFLASFTSWRDGFYINVPLTLLMLILSCKTLDHKKTTHERFDILGTLLSVTGIFSFVYSINGANNFILWFTLSILLLVCFVICEYKTEIPIMPLSLFQNRIRRGAYIARVLYMCAMFGFWFFISECLQDVFHYSPILTGFAFFPMTISIFIAALIVPHLVNKYGNTKVLMLGIFFLLCGFIWILFLTDSGTYMINIMIPLLLLGLGQGFCMSPLTNLGIYGTNQKNAGAASSMVNVAHQIGGSIGLSIMVALTQTITPMMAVFHHAMIIGFVFVIIMLFVSILFFIKNEWRR